MLNMTAKHHAKKASEFYDNIGRQIEYHRKHGNREAMEEAIEMKKVTSLMIYHNTKELEAHEETSMSDYEKAKELGLTSLDRREDGIEHHQKSEQLMKFLAEHDLHDYDDYFCWKTGGDGDNGETLMYEMDTFFESLDQI